MPRLCRAFYLKFRAKRDAGYAGRGTREGYLIYAIERARGGYLNNLIRILFQYSINAFWPYRAVRFCREKAGNAAAAGGSWTGEELTRVDIYAIGRLGRRGGLAGEGG